MNKKHRTDITEVTICYSCGSEKSNPLDICECCKAIPTSQDQILVSLCSTSFIIGLAELEKVREGISKGIPPKIGSETRKFLLDALKQGGSDMNKIMVTQRKYVQTLSKDKVLP